MTMNLLLLFLVYFSEYIFLLMATETEQYSTTSVSTKGVPNGLWTSDSGKVVISSDDEGYVYVSKDYGSTWFSGKTMGDGQMIIG